jgi:hypothetical protein
MFRKKLEWNSKHTFYVQWHFFENRVVCEITWKNIAVRGRPRMTIWRMRVACWIPKATNTNSEYVILINVPLQQWLQEHALVLRYTYVASLVRILNVLLPLAGNMLMFRCLYHKSHFSGNTLFSLLSSLSLLARTAQSPWWFGYALDDLKIMTLRKVQPKSETNPVSYSL